MKPAKPAQHTTNYFNTFIEVAPDYTATTFQVPVAKNNKKTIAVLQYEMLAKHPYKFTSDEVLFQVYAKKNDLTKAEYPAAREAFFAKGQACMRASPLTKKQGFGIHANATGKIALAGLGTKEYDALVADNNVKKVKAMRSSK